MEALIWHLVYGTFAVQMFAFAIPVAGAVWFLIKETILLPVPAETAARPKGGGRAALDKELQPLNCSNCGAGVPLNEASMECSHCRTAFPVPPEYQEIRHLRQLANEKIRRAQTYWKTASIATSDVVLGMAVFLAIWLIVCLVLMISWIGTPKIAPFDEFLEVYKVPGLTLIFWIGTLVFIAISISLKFKRRLPQIERLEASTRAETISCSNCGGAVGFQAGQFGALCGYCGVDIFRVKVAQAAVRTEGETAERASDRLSSEMEHFKEAVEEFLALPILVVAGAGVLVLGWLLVTGGLSVILTMVVWAVVYLIAGVAYYPIPTIIGLIAAIAAWICRKRLSETVKGTFRS